MRVDSIKRQICLLLSIITILSGMCLFSEQADACFGWNASISLQGMEQKAVLSSGETITVQDFSCTGEMLGAKNFLSARSAVSRYFSGVRNKMILALSFVGLFLFILIMFQMAVDQFGFCNKPGHTVIIQYIHHKDGKKLSVTISE